MASSPSHQARSARPDDERTLPLWACATVVLLVIYALVVIGPDTLRLLPVDKIPNLGAWYPLGTLGFQADDDGKVTAVDKDGPAAKKGFQEGDWIDLAAPTTDRRAVDLAFVAHDRPSGGKPATGVCLSPDDEKLKLAGRRPYTLHVSLGGKPATDVCLWPDPEKLTLARWPSLLLAQLSAFFFLWLCWHLVWHYPTPQTVGLFLYSIWFNSGQGFILPANLPDAWLPWFDYLEACFQATGLAGILLFAIYFPRDTVDGWRRTAARLLPIPWAVIFWYALGGFQIFMHGQPTGDAYRTYYVLTWCVFAAMSALLFDTYRTLTVERPRIRWVILGALWALLWFLVAEETYQAAALFVWLPRVLGVSNPESVLNLFYAQTVFFPLAVFYAIRHDRVIKVRFGITRAVILSTVFVVSIAAVDQVAKLPIESFMEERAALKPFAVPLSFLLAIGLALLHNPLHGAVERVCAPRWHRTEQRLKAVTEELIDEKTPSLAAINQRVLDELVSALELTSGALFRRSKRGHFERERAVGWPDGVITRLAADDPLVAQLHDGPKSGDQIDWSAHARSPEFMKPALAVAIVRHHAIARIALFGPHRTGELLDRDEIGIVKEVARAAAVAYERLETDALRQEVATLRARLGEDTGTR